MNKHKLAVSAMVLSFLLALTAGGALAQGPGGGKPIKSIVAGAGLTGGGDSGDVTLAVANTYRLPQACASGQIAKWNGTAWTCADDGLTMPFAGSANTSAIALEFANAGTGPVAVFDHGTLLT